MQIKGALSDRPPYNKFLLLVGMVLIFSVLFTLLGSIVANALYGVNVMTNPEALTDFSDPLTVSALKVLQTFSAFGTFLIPSLLAAYLFSPRAAHFLGLTHSPSFLVIGLTVVLLVLAVPLINWMLEFNNRLILPRSMQGIEQWMKEKESLAAKITEAFLKDPSASSMLVNIFVMALLPAIGEELLFRGVIQRLFGELIAHRAMSIILTAFLFSALHLQFYGFLPRFMLGVLFGYLFVWSGSLWLPILAHFINNAGAIILTWLAARGELGFNPDMLGTQAGDTLFLFASVMLSGMVIWLIHRYCYRSEIREEFRLGRKI